MIATLILVIILWICIPEILDLLGMKQKNISVYDRYVWIRLARKYGSNQEYISKPVDSYTDYLSSGS